MGGDNRGEAKPIEGSKVLSRAKPIEPLTPLAKPQTDHIPKQAAIAEKRHSTRMNALLVGGASYDRRTVISTSVPPLEELNREGLVEPGEDIL